MAFGDLKNLPDPEERKLAENARDVLNSCFKKNAKVYEFEIKQEGKNNIIRIPFKALGLLFEILKQMANGNSVTLIPNDAQLTTQEAANYLNVSRPYLIKLLEEDQIPYFRIGRHRRIKFTDLLKYKTKLLDASQKAREELTKDAQDLNLGY